MIFVFGNLQIEIISKNLGNFIKRNFCSNEIGKKRAISFSQLGIPSLNFLKGKHGIQSLENKIACFFQLHSNRNLYKINKFLLIISICKFPLKIRKNNRH